MNFIFLFFINLNFWCPPQVGLLGALRTLCTLRIGSGGPVYSRGPARGHGVTEPRPASLSARPSRSWMGLGCCWPWRL
jgi:hypothetical protein